jgi:spore coat polysaccharide biosynthesis protein SpsF
MKIVGIVQARMGSTRLPGKVLAPLAGEPMLYRVVTRLESAASVDETVVATTVAAADDELVAACEDRGIAVQRGSEEDVLDRYHETALARGADAVVRITSDCPFVDPELVDRVVTAYREERPRIDYASNIHPRRTFPRGLDVEVFSRAVLARIWREEDDPGLREHVTPTIWRNPERFRLHNVTGDEDLSHHRWTVDTPADLLLAQVVYEHFDHDRFAWTEVLELMQTRPELAALNARVQQREVVARGGHGRDPGGTDRLGHRSETGAAEVPGEEDGIRPAGRRRAAR